MPATHEMTDTNRIEKEVQLRASKSRVWRALTDAAEFGSWFGLKLEGPFVLGKPVSGKVTSPGYEHLVLELTVETVEPQDLFAYRWHPHALDTSVDYSTEATTLVEFRLYEIADGTRLTVVESGFDNLSPERRALALVGNDKGWTSQMERIRRHVDG
ncbi:MAG: SRPBCC family protein [Gemmatimonadaceae bacterium]